MCPACIAGVAVAAGSATSAGGVTALILKKIFSKIPRVKGANPKSTKGE